MDNEKTGKAIKSLRIEKGMTQKVLADKLNISYKTISKWETGTGFPDISMLTLLSKHLGVDIESLLNGDLSLNNQKGENMKNNKYYMCPVCGNITVCTGDTNVSCCGHKLEALVPQKAEETEKMKIEKYVDELYITSDSPMTREDYIPFAAFAVGGSVEVIRAYPEWDFGIHITNKKHGRLMWYSTTKGFFYQNI